MKSINRIFSIAVAVILMCANVVAQEIPAPPQDSEGFYRLSTQQDLAWFAQKTYNEVNVSARLTNDITLTFSQDFVGQRLLSANPEKPFEGTFDGNNYTIHLNGVEPNEYLDYVGLFRYAGNCEVKNLRIDGNLLSHSQYTASFVGLAKGVVTISNCVSDVVFKSYYSGANKVCAGFIAKVNNGGKHFKITNSAFRGHTIEMEASSSAKLCGLVGESAATSSVGGVVSNSYVYCESDGIKTANATVYPIGDVTDNSNYLTVSKFYVLTPAVGSLVNYNSLEVNFASAAGFAGNLASDKVTRVELVHEENFFYSLPTDYYGKNRKGCYLTELGESYYSLSNDYYDSNGVINNDSGEYVYVTYLKEADYNVDKFLDNSVWTKGVKYPEIIVPETYITSAEQNWTAASWSDKMPNSNKNVRIKKGQTVIVAGSSVVTGRDIVVEDGGTLYLTSASSCTANVINVLSGGSLILDSKTTLNVLGMVSVADDALLKLKYSPTGDSPSLLYEGEFVGNAIVERTFYPAYMTHVGSSIKEHTYESFTNYAFASYFDVNNGWADADYIDEHLGAGVFPGDVTTARVIGIATDQEKEGPQQYVMTEKGTPVSSVETFEVSTHSPIDGYCTYNNPYPYTVDVTGFEHGNTVAWKECVGNGFKILTYNKKSGYVTNQDGDRDESGPYIPPFKAVTYQISDGAESMILPNKKASVSRESKSELVIDCIAVELFVDNSATPSDEFALVYSENGTLETDVINLDSPVSRCTDIDGTQTSSQIIVRKPESDVDLAVAIVPKMANIIGEAIPFYVVAPESGVQTLKISAPKTKIYEGYYTLYIYDKASKWMQNITSSDYIVPQVDNLFENRFLLVLVEEGDIPVIEDDTITSIESISADNSLDNVIITSKDGKVIVNNVPDELIGSDIAVYNTLGVKVSSTPAEINNTLDAEGKGVRAVVINNQSKKVMVK